MKKNKFVKSTIILIIGGGITKLLGMAIRIVTTRMIGTEGMGIYMLITPTFMLLIGLAQFGMPVAISKLVSENKRNNKKLVFSVIPITMVINIIIIIVLFLISPVLSNSLLKEPKTFYGLISIGLVLPFISISCIIRGYFFGKEKMFPHVVSNVCEDFVRLIIIIIGIPVFLKQGIEYAIAFIILANIASEVSSILILLFFLPNKFKIQKSDFKINKTDLKDVLSISLPTTGSRLIGSIGYFLEPIILTYALLKTGYSNSYILNEYGVLNGYIMPFLLLPSFFTTAISNALIPAISNAYSNKKYDYSKNKLKQAIFFSLLIGIPLTIIFLIFPEKLLSLIYNTNLGLNYLYFLAPVFLLFYIQAPLTGSLQAMGKATKAMNGTLQGIIFKLSIIYIGSLFNLGMWSLVLAISFNIVYVTIHHLIAVIKIFKSNHSF